MTRAVSVPAALAARLTAAEGAEGRAWVSALPARVAELARAWDLEVDGAARAGFVALVVPVRTSDGSAAVLKVSWVDDETRHEAAALTAWEGRGAVRLLRKDPAHGALLLEGLDSDLDLTTVGEEAATLAWAGLVRRLSVPAPAGLRRLEDLASRWVEDLPREWERHGRPLDRLALDAAVEACAALGPTAATTLVHGDLHHGNVLGGRREAWLAIDPKPLAGDPEFDLVPLLRNRWADVVASGHVQNAVRRRMAVAVEAGGLDPDRARGWVLARAVDDVLWGTAQRQREFTDIARTVASAVLD